MFPIRTCPVVRALPKSIQYMGDRSLLEVCSRCFFRNRQRFIRERMLSVQVTMMFARAGSSRSAEAFSG